MIGDGHHSGVSEPPCPLVYFLQRVDDDIFPMKDGNVLTADIDYMDVWKV